MKKRKYNLPGILIIPALIFIACCIIYMGIDKPINVTTRLSIEVDSLNDELRDQNDRTYAFILDEVTKKGSRRSDLQVLKKAKQVAIAFQPISTLIQHLQAECMDKLSQGKSLHLADDDVRDFAAEYQSLLHFIDTSGHKTDKLLGSHIVENLSSSNPEITFNILTGLETSLLYIEDEMAHHIASYIGAKDVSFDIPPPIIAGARIDSVMNIFDESYQQVYENPFMASQLHPLSTFSVDVDKAAFANIRRYLTQKFMPPPDAVKIEEMVNYFNYDYPEPDASAPVSITTEYARCPWSTDHNLLMVGLKGKDLNKKFKFEELPANNLVFLIDVSGSMNGENKLDLVKSSMKLLTRKLREKDRVSIVVYASASGVVLPSTSGKNKTKIITAIDKLSAGGYTAGGEGIELAYKIASQNFIPGGNNRVIIATDGDFNVGPSNDADMYRLITKYRDSGVYITCLGFGMGNYKDSIMETIAENGNGNYAYIDSQAEAEYILGSGFSGTLYTIAKDVKIQVEFNPAYVQEYRLIGYENRVLLPEDFINDAVDAGDIGSGHSVTAFYEIIPAGDQTHSSDTVPTLKYQTLKPNKKAGRGEIATVKFRYKTPEDYKSKEVVKVVRDKVNHEPNRNFILGSAVAELGLILRNSKHKGSASLKRIKDSVNSIPNIENDEHWAGFLDVTSLVEQSETLEFRSH